MINRSKHKFIAFVLFAIALAFFAIGFFQSHIEYAQNNWYVKTVWGDKEKEFLLIPNVPFTVKTDDWIKNLTFRRYPLIGYKDTLKSYLFADKGFFTWMSGAACERHFNITSKDTVILTISFYLSGFYYVDAEYEVHKGVSEGRNLYFNGEILTYKRNF